MATVKKETAPVYSITHLGAIEFAVLKACLAVALTSEIQDHLELCGLVFTTKRIIELKTELWEDIHE